MTSNTGDLGEELANLYNRANKLNCFDKNIVSHSLEAELSEGMSIISGRS